MNTNSKEAASDIQCHDEIIEPTMDLYVQLSRRIAQLTQIFEFKSKLIIRGGAFLEKVKIGKVHLWHQRPAKI